MKYADYIQKAIDYIEAHILEDITVEACAEEAGFSKYHFHRIFSVCVGMSVMGYVRKRKLTYAMRDVSMGRRIIDIAIDYGYSSERAFGRAFLQEFLGSPSQFRGCGYHVPPMIKIQEKINQGGYIMQEIYSEVYLETLENMTVVSAVVISQNPEEEVMKLLTDWAGATGIEISRNFGFDVPVSEPQQKEGIRGYEYWLQVEKKPQVLKEMTVKHIEGCQYAVLKITDPFQAPFEIIPQGWKHLVQWINQKGYLGNAKKQCYCLEEVIEENGVTYMKVMIPIN